MARKALLVGINAYANPGFNLRGCVNDVESLARLLSQNYGFGSGDIEMLRDAAATRSDILGRAQALAAAAAPGDMFVFGYAGHGTQVASTDPGEEDGRDECIVPYEAKASSLIKDDELFAIFAPAGERGVKLTAIYDCCHSGTMLRSASLDEDGLLVEDVINRFIDISDLAPAADQVRDLPRPLPYNVLSACLDAQTAADVREAGAEKLPRGAFSYALHRFLTRARDVPVSLAEPQILADIQSLSRHPQTPAYSLADPAGPLIAC